MDPISILSGLSAAGLSEVQADLRRLLRESIRLTACPPDGVQLSPGSSRLGGLPDLPGGITWPAWKGVPMSFIAQIQLEDLKNLVPAQELPKKGLLALFYDSTQETYGADPADRGGWKVFFFPPAPAAGNGWHLLGSRQAGLTPAQAPAALLAGARFKPCSLSFTLEWSLPVAPAQVIPNLSWSADQIQRYEGFYANFPRAEDRRLPHHRMFGWPNQIQDDMQLQCALYANGIPSMDDPRAAEAARQKANWQLLLQIDSDDKAGMRWASSGMIYYWLERDALQQAAFDKSWLVLQSE
jgi:uncharacterized protein YwqG